MTASSKPRAHTPRTSTPRAHKPRAHTPRAHTPRTSTPRARCRVGDIVKKVHLFVVLSISRGEAKVGFYDGPGTLTTPCETRNTATVRSWPLVGRCRPEPLTADSSEYILHPTSETP